MFFEIETQEWVNDELVDKVEPKHSKRTATLWAGGIVLCADSSRAYAYFFSPDEPSPVDGPLIRKI